MTTQIKTNKKALSHDYLDGALNELLQASTKVTLFLATLLVDIRTKFAAFPVHPLRISGVADPSHPAIPEIVKALKASTMVDDVYRVFRLAGELCDLLAQTDPKGRLFHQRGVQYHAWADTTHERFTLALNQSEKRPIAWNYRLGRLVGDDEEDLFALLRTLTNLLQTPRFTVATFKRYFSTAGALATNLDKLHRYTFMHLAPTNVPHLKDPT